MFLLFFQFVHFNNKIGKNFQKCNMLLHSHLLEILGINYLKLQQFDFPKKCFLLKNFKFINFAYESFKYISLNYIFFNLQIYQ